MCALRLQHAVCNAPHHKVRGPAGGIRRLGLEGTQHGSSDVYLLARVKPGQGMPPPKGSRRVVHSTRLTSGRWGKSPEFGAS